MGGYALLINYGPGKPVGGRNNSTILRLCAGTCTADFDLRTSHAGADVIARVVGYFSPLARTVEIPASPPSPEALEFAESRVPGGQIVGFDGHDIGYGPGDGVNERVPFTFFLDQRPRLIFSAWVVLDLTIRHGDFNTDTLWFVDQPVREGSNTNNGAAWLTPESNFERGFVERERRIRRDRGLKRQAFRARLSL